MNFKCGSVLANVAIRLSPVERSVGITGAIAAHLTFPVLGKSRIGHL